MREGKNMGIMTTFKKPTLESDPNRPRPRPERPGPVRALRRRES
jgi:hypothetical protein